MADPVVEVQSGLVRGVVEKHEEGFDYYAFRGIPYAEAPIGELRFKDPVPVKQWTGVMNCKDYGPICLQYDLLAHTTSYNEDCLYLNVFTRSINETEANNPVMLVIHGGGFSFGSGNDLLYGPEYLIRKNLVLVTFNYRLGILGFLNLEHEVAPGNQGLKDQLMVLKWIQQNIRSFGGDPNNVTVYGISAGSVSAHYAAVSPLTTGLVHKVICHGAGVFNPWAKFTNGLSNAIKLCSLLGTTLTDPEEIFKFLKSVDAKELQEAQERLRVLLNALPFGPGTDCKSPSPYLPVDVQVATDQCIQLPCLIGYTQHEGKFLLAEDFFKTADLDFEAAMPYNAKSIADRYNLTPKQVRALYYKDEIVSEKNLDNFVEFATDFYFVEGIHKLARIQAEQSSAATYMYQFCYDHPNSLSKLILKITLSGQSHLDDLPFLFKCRFYDVMGVDHYKKGTEQYKMMEKMTEMLSNFARYGKPTIDLSELIPVHWQPIDNGTALRYLNMDVDFKMKSTTNVDQKLSAAKNIKA